MARVSIERDMTAIGETTGDSRWTEVVEGRLRPVESQLAKEAGQPARSPGGGVISSFGSARAAAQAIQRANADETTESHLQIGIGLRTDEIIASGSVCFGTVINKSARSVALVAPRNVRVSDATRIMAGGTDEFRLADSVAVSLEGLERAYTLFKLEWGQGA